MFLEDESSFSRIECSSILLELSNICVLVGDIVEVVVSFEVGKSNLSIFEIATKIIVLECLEYSRKAECLQGSECRLKGV